MPLHIDTTMTPTVTILRCRGRMVLGDGTTSLREAFRRALARGQVIALDLGLVTHMDAHGVGVLAEVCAMARQRGRALFLVRASRRVSLLLRITRLDTVIPRSTNAGSDAATVTIGSALLCEIA